MPPPISELLRSRQSRHSNKNDASHEDTLLPLHGTTQKGHATLRIGSPSLPSNNFLLGGMYVPNKDHRRRRMVRPKHRNYFYQLLNSRDPLSRSAMFFFILFGVFALHYGGIFHVQIRSTLSSSGSNIASNSRHQFRRPSFFGSRQEALLSDPSLLKRLLPSSQERSMIQTTYQKRLQQQSSSKRLAILEALVPKWFHRNDVLIPNEEATPVKPKVNTDLKLDLPSQQKKSASSDKTKGHDAIANPEFRTASPKRREHTLLNMDNLSNESPAAACPIDLTDPSISLVMQSTLDRIWILQETCQRWKSPIILVIAVRPSERLDLSNLLHDHWTMWNESCSQLNFILYHLNPETEGTPEQYPVNALRNVALDAVQTSHILVLDVDFVPSDQLDQVILLVLSEQLVPTDIGIDAEKLNQIAMVVPAFERSLNPPCTTDSECSQHLQTDNSFIPRTFEELKECYDDHNCIVFQKEVNWEGHSSTRTKDWLQRKWYNDEPNDTQGIKQEALKIRTIPCFDSLRYEPYVVIQWCPLSTKDKKRSNLQAPLAPYYDERFHGYGKNKIQLISHLRLMGYQFHVLPKGFIVHNPHVESASKETWNQRNDEKSLHRSMDVLYQNFLHELVDKYLAAEDQPSKIVNACVRHTAS